MNNVISFAELLDNKGCIPEIKLIKTKVYAGRIKDRDVLNSSSSGGAYTALTDLFLSVQCAVISAIYNYETYQTEFQIITTKNERNLARGSKYMQSKPGDVFKKAEIWLKNNPRKQLLFVGMGCQADGFRKYAELKGFRNRVYIVDIICHGSPSPKLWREYAELIEQKHVGKIDYLTFKDKRKGWNLPTAVAMINGKEISIKDYVRVFYNHCALRPSCHVCPFTTTERKTDITVGDFWHIEERIPDFYDKAGTSLFLIHTISGERLFEAIKENIEYRESDTVQCWQENLEAPTPVSEIRSEFWDDYKYKGISYIMKKYGSMSIQAKLKRILPKVIRGGYSLNSNTSNYADYSERRAA